MINLSLINRMSKTIGNLIIMMKKFDRIPKVDTIQIILGWFQW